MLLVLILLMCLLTPYTTPRIGTLWHHPHTSKRKPPLEPLSPRIIGGSAVRLGEIPYQLSLRIDGTHKCGAILIFPAPGYQVALTAAHCTYFLDSYNNIKWTYGPTDFTVVAGAIKLSDRGPPVQERRVTRIIRHELYDRTNDNDIAILILDEPFSIGQYVRPIQLPAYGQSTTNRVTISGWGNTKYLGMVSQYLQKVTVPIIPWEKCKKLNKAVNKVSKTMICGGNVDRGGVGSCHGDSGGPVVALSYFRQRYFPGVVSWSNGCGWSGYPSVFTEVAWFVDWIHNQVIEHVNQYGGH